MRHSRLEQSIVEDVGYEWAIATDVCYELVIATNTAKSDCYG